MRKEVRMENPRPEKVAVVDEVRERLTGSEAALLTEYRGLTVAESSVLRRALRAAGGDYKIYKNTLVRFAARDLGLDLDELLTGPTAIAFVPKDGSGDAVTVAKALRDFAKANPNLVVKGGVLGEKLLSSSEVSSLAEVAPREELLSRLAGGIQAPLQNMAGLLQAPLRDFASLLQALIDDRGGAPEGATAETTDTENTDTETAEATEADAAAPAAEVAAGTDSTATDAVDAPADDAEAPASEDN
jgi:large subunit ribosomal protein L10